MMRSLYSGVAGLRTHQTKMDVIGNNIANVNTTSYKSQSITFSDLMYQTTQNASGATQTKGGVNARQIGLGVRSGAINTTITSQGATQTTNNPFDIMITGDSFFVVNNGNKNLYTRDGSFYIDGAGNLAMQSNGYLVQGWSAMENAETGEISINKNSGLSGLQIMSAANSTYAPASTTSALFSGNIDSRDSNIVSDNGKTVTLELFDNKGYLYTGKFTLKNTGKDHNFALTLTDIINSDGKSIDKMLADGTSVLSHITFGEVKKENPVAYNNAFTTTVNNNTINFASNTEVYENIPKNGLISDLTESSDSLYAGILKNIYEITDKDARNYGLDGTYEINDNGDLILSTGKHTINLEFDAATGGIVSANGIGNGFVNMIFDQSIKTLEAFGHQAGANDTSGKVAGSLNIDFSTMTNYNTNGSSTIKAVKGDSKSLNTGRAVGEMNGVSISNDGQIFATYSNGQTKLLGQIASAEFANASGLSKEGDNLYNATLNSGEATIQDITTDGGYMSTGVLEMSNVDLSREFTEMITTQRGFQANSRIITVSDTLLEELANLKR